MFGEIVSAKNWRWSKILVSDGLAIFDLYSFESINLAARSEPSYAFNDADDVTCRAWLSRNSEAINWRDWREFFAASLRESS